MPKKAGKTNQLFLFSVLCTANETDDHADIANRIEADFKACGAADYIFQLERGTELQKLHWQCYLKLSDKSRIRTLLNLLNEPFQDSSPYRVKPCSLRGARQLKTYCMKKETSIGHLRTLRKLYRGEDLAPMSTPLPWQSDLLSVISTEPDDRTIHWVYNPRGCVGKSMLVKHLVYNELAVRIPTCTATQIKNGVILLGPARVYLVDIPRTLGKNENLEDIMSSLESVKGGLVQSMMYGIPKQLLMMPPHVFCFSNHPAPKSMASSDRWRTYTIRDKQDSLQADPAVHAPMFNRPY